MFKDRWEAGAMLARALAPKYQSMHPLILAIPRGGVPLGKVIADTLSTDLDVVLVRKLGSPYSPEVAVGAVSENGSAFIPDYGKSWANENYIKNEISKQMGLLKKRRIQYTPVRPPINPTGRVVIVVDDGLATGSTMVAALQAVKAQIPKQLICAIPVSSYDAFATVSRYCDEVVCLHKDHYFQAVGQYYQHFDQVEDSEVIEMLKQT